MSDLDRLLEFAIGVAQDAGRLTLGWFGADLRPDLKADDSPVTIADREAERLIRERIGAEYPSHGLLGEEYGEQNPGASHRWLIDPIDGTRSFVRGVPLYAVLLGLEIDGRTEVGVACFPALGETVWAASGRGCFLNGRRCFVRDTASLTDSVVSFTDESLFERYGRTAEWQAVRRAVPHRVGWSDAYGHALVATGRLELMLDPGMNPWDCGPFPVLLREAGGYFGDWSGTEGAHGGEALSTSRRLLPQVLELIGGRGPAAG